MTEHLTTATIEADPQVPAIRITRDFRADPEQVFRAHTDPDLYARWVGPHELSTRIDHWDARTGGSYRFTNLVREGSERRLDGGEEEFHFFGSFHEVRPDRVVQTFTYEGFPDGVSLETMTFEDLGGGWTRLHSHSLMDSFEAREMMLSSGMDIGVHEGYETLDSMLAEGVVA
ncbi:SRPBCC family protein [Janibacter corallicola]|uniref:SRPBCC family protein n=1 Tax=Janibacter corallicola TaxID=415212 RepID=UPI0008371F65|nr:SRPBCC family protein [Janibacter corallicola]